MRPPLLFGEADRDPPKPPGSRGDSVDAQVARAVPRLERGGGPLEGALRKLKFAKVPAHPVLGVVRAGEHGAVEIEQRGANPVLAAHLEDRAEADQIDREQRHTRELAGVAKEGRAERLEPASGPLARPAPPDGQAPARR